MVIKTAKVSVSGKILDIEYTDALVSRVREAFGLNPLDELDESLIIEYLKNEVRSALSKLPLD